MQVQSGKARCSVYIYDYTELLYNYLHDQHPLSSIQNFIGLTVIQHENTIYGMFLQHDWNINIFLSTC